MTEYKIQIQYYYPHPTGIWFNIKGKNTERYFSLKEALKEYTKIRKSQKIVGGMYWLRIVRVRSNKQRCHQICSVCKKDFWGSSVFDRWCPNCRKRLEEVTHWD